MKYVKLVEASNAETATTSLKGENDLDFGLYVINYFISIKDKEPKAVEALTIINDLIKNHSKLSQYRKLLIKPSEANKQDNKRNNPSLLQSLQTSVRNIFSKEKSPQK